MVIGGVSPSNSKFEPGIDRGNSQPSAYQCVFLFAFL